MKVSLAGDSGCFIVSSVICIVEVSSDDYSYSCDCDSRTCIEL